MCIWRNVFNFVSCDYNTVALLVQFLVFLYIPNDVVTAYSNYVVIN